VQDKSSLEEGLMYIISETGEHSWSDKADILAHFFLEKESKAYDITILLACPSMFIHNIL
jgi:hypothetical protein